MEEKAGNYKEYPNHFQLTETHLRKIHSVLEEYAAKIDTEAFVSIYIARENDSFFETRNLETIFTDENTSGKSIKTLTMEIIVAPEDGKESSEKERSKSYIAFTKDKDTRIRFWTSYKERDWCFLLLDELDTQVQRIIKNKPTSIIKAKVIDLAVALLLLSIFMGVVVWNSVDSQLDLQSIMTYSMEEKIDFLVEQQVEKNNIKSIWFIPGLALMMLIFLFVLEFKPITKLVKASNTSVFYWGDMVAVYDSYIQKLTRIKWSVIVAFVVSLAATLVGSFVV